MYIWYLDEKSLGHWQQLQMIYNAPKKNFQGMTNIVGLELVTQYKWSTISIEKKEKTCRIGDTKYNVKGSSHLQSFSTSTIGPFSQPLQGSLEQVSYPKQVRV